MLDGRIKAGKEVIITVVLNYKSVVTAATTLCSLRHFPFPNGAYRSHCAVCDFLQHGTFSDVMQIPPAVYHLLVSVLIIRRRKLTSDNLLMCFCCVARELLGTFLVSN